MASFTFPEVSFSGFTREQVPRKMTIKVWGQKHPVLSMWLHFAPIDYPVSSFKKVVNGNGKSEAHPDLATFSGQVSLLCEQMIQ